MENTVLRLFLIKLQVWYLFKENLAKTAFALHSHHSLLLIRFTFYSAPSSSSLILLLILHHCITTTAGALFLFLCFWFKFKRLENLVSHFHFHQCHFLFRHFFCLSQFCFIFLVAAHEKDSFKACVRYFLSNF